MKLIRNLSSVVNLATETLFIVYLSPIVGKDNYPANVVDDLFNEIAYPHQLKVSRDNFNSSILKPLNAGYYHR